MPANAESAPLTPGPDDWPNNRSNPPIGSRDYLNPSIREAILLSIRSQINQGHTNYRTSQTIRDLAMAVAPDLNDNYPSLRKTLGAIYLQPKYVQQGEVEKTLYKELYRLLERNVTSNIVRLSALEAQRERRAIRGLEGFSLNTLYSDNRGERSYGTAGLEGFSSATLQRDDQSHGPSNNRGEQSYGTAGLEGFRSSTLQRDTDTGRTSSATFQGAGQSTRSNGTAGLEGFSTATLETYEQSQRTRTAQTGDGLQRYLENMHNIIRQSSPRQPGIHQALNSRRRRETPTAPPETSIDSDSNAPPPSYHIVANNGPPAAGPTSGGEVEPLVPSDVPDCPPPSYDQVMNWS